jgi:hypothetical protein
MEDESLSSRAIKKAICGPHTANEIHVHFSTCHFLCQGHSQIQHIGVEARLSHAYI